MRNELAAVTEGEVVVDDFVVGETVILALKAFEGELLGVRVDRDVADVVATGNTVEVVGAGEATVVLPVGALLLGDEELEVDNGVVEGDTDTEEVV